MADLTPELNFYHLGHKDGCRCCYNDRDAWVGVVSQLGPDDFLMVIAQALPDIPQTYQGREYGLTGPIVDKRYADAERIHQVLLRIGGITLHTHHEYGPQVDGPWILGEHDLEELGSIENILRGGTWGETAERHAEAVRVISEERAAADLERLRQRELEDLRRLQEKYGE